MQKGGFVRIIIEIENKNDFDIDRMVMWLNSELSIMNTGTGDSFWARFIGIEEENDEND